MRVLAPIKVSILAFLLCFCLNIYSTLGRRRAARLGFHGHSLRLPNESLTKAMTAIAVSAAVNLEPDAGRLEPLRQLYEFVVILKVTKGVCQADAVVWRDLRESQARRLALQQAVDGNRCAAGHFLVRLAGLHQD